MRRGEVYLVDLDPSLGAESQKTRPAILVSNDAANRVAERNRRGVVTVVPVTSNTTRVYPFQVLIAAGEGGLDKESKAQAEQIRSVDVVRLTHRMGTLQPATVRNLDDAIRLHLGL
jgi:mRNA interferase MazF